MNTLQVQYTTANSNPGYLETSRYLGQKLHLLFPLDDVDELFTTWYSERWLCEKVFCLSPWGIKSYSLAAAEGPFQY